MISFVAALLVMTVPLSASEPSTKEITDTLDRFHQAASKADGQVYFDLFAPEGIFIGTDASERWTVEEFKKYASPHFSKGKGWTYVPRDRHVDFAPGGEI